MIILILALQATPAPAQNSRDSSLRDTTRAFPTGTVLNRQVLRMLPLDDPREALSLVPGVVRRGTFVGISAGDGLSIRGAGFGQASVYIDGAPARWWMTGDQAMTLATGAVEQIAVTTGVANAGIADARAGLVEYTTRSGSAHVGGDLSIRSDALAGAGSRVGYNRLTGDLGGPLGARLTWYLSGEVTGQRSAYRGLGAAQQPSFVWGSIDTVVNGVGIPTFIESNGLRRPLDWLTQRRSHAKLIYSYGAGSTIAITGLAGDLQQRFFPGADIGDPALFTGVHQWSEMAVLNWDQQLGSRLRLHSNVSFGRDRLASGLLTPASELASRDPSLGIEWSAFAFTGTDSIPLPITDQIIRNIRTNSGVRVPFLNRTDLRNVQPYRLNPYGLESGWPTQGSDGSLTLQSESRLSGRAWLDFRQAPNDTLSGGLDFDRVTEASYQAGGLLSEINLDAWIVHPRRLGAFIRNRATIGNLDLDLGLRLDHYTPGGSLPLTPGRIFTNPSWSAGAGASDTAYANSIARVYKSAAGHAAFSPRANAEYQVSSRFAARLGIGQTAEPLTGAELFGGSNADGSFINLSETLFGRDVAFKKSTLGEVGLRYGPLAHFRFDVAAFHQWLASYAYRITPFDDPANPGVTLNVNVLTAINNFQATGVEGAAGWRPSPFVGTSLVYSFVRSERFTTQGLSGLTAIQVPATWAPGTAYGTALRDVSLALTLHAESGLPYLRLLNLGNGDLAPENPFIFGESPLGQGRLPWTKTLDLRLGKSLRARGVQGEIYVDLRNLLDLHNVLGAFAETSTQSNALFKVNVLAPEYSGLHIEASSNGTLLAGNAIDLRPDCASWTATTSGPVDCAVLRRVERRFGNGDGVYDLNEQTNALEAYYNSIYGPWRFLAPSRTVRIGFDLAF